MTRFRRYWFSTGVLAIALEAQTTSTSAARSDDNPLLTASTLSYQFPPFDRIRNEHFPAAIEQGMADELKEVQAIAENDANPTFENTVVALERSGRLLERAVRIWSALLGAHTNPALQRQDRELSPRLSAHRDAIVLNSRLFSRIEKLHAEKDKLGLDAESKYLLDRYYKDFVRAGAKLPDSGKEKLKAINTELATLQTRFSQNVLKEKNSSSILVETRAELEGMPENEIASAAAAAKEEGREGKFLIRLQNTTGQPALTFLKDRALRQRIFEASLGRNSRAGEFDNRDVILRTARLRGGRAALLGYTSHAAYRLEDQTARTVEAVNKMLGEITPSAVANARSEAKDMQAVIDEEKAGFRLAGWDWDFYSEKDEGHGTPSMSRSCGHTSNSTASCRTASSSLQTESSASRSKNGKTCQFISPMSVCSKYSMPMESRSRCFWRTTTHVRRSAAARGPTHMYFSRSSWETGR